MKMKRLLSAVCLVSLGLIGRGEAASDPPPFYADKDHLLHYIDADSQVQPVRTPAEWQIRRGHILASAQLVMGPLPGDAKMVPLDVRVTQVETLPRVTRQTLTYASEPGHRVPAYLLIPREIKGKVPAMLCLHGTGGPRGRIAGLGADYARYALELAERGYVTLAPDYIFLGDNKGGGEFQEIEALGYVSGTMKGIWDHMRAVDLLQALPEVDGERLGVIGNSLGGHNAVYVGLFDPRLKVIVSSVGFDSMRYRTKRGIAGLNQKYYTPRAATHYGSDPHKMPYEWSELLAALAPRAFFAHSPVDDHNFEVAAARKSFASAREVYAFLGAADRIKMISPPDGHFFAPASREVAYRFIDAQFGMPPPKENRPAP